MTPSQKLANERLDGVLRRHGWNMSVPWFLMASYLYYHHDLSLLTDEKFDWMCKEMLKRCDTINHRHKHLIDLGDLKAGTGYAIQDYPEITMGGATEIAKEIGLIEWDKKRKAYRSASSTPSKPKKH